MVVEDTPIRESRHKRQASTSSAGGSAGSSTSSPIRSIRPFSASTGPSDHRRRRPTPSCPGPFADDERPPQQSRRKTREPKEENVTLGPTVREGESVFGVAHIFASFNDTFIICLEICFEPTTTPCGHRTNPWKMLIEHCCRSLW
ncbi:uncharacterized protein [Miscanthus floridulus]|uniref:uncharacterized protein isoform X2 n=1 Tax=Miscanthus floridulus TaxID=154761 RepID=UPI003459473A